MKLSIVWENCQSRTPKPTYSSLIIKAGWPSGLRRWFTALDTSMALVRVRILSVCWHSYTKYCFPYFKHLHMVSSTIINTIDFKTYRQDGWVEWTAGFRHQSLWWRGFESYHCHFVDIPKESIVSFILYTCSWCYLHSSMQLTTKHTGRMAEWYKELVYGIRHFDGVGSSPTPDILSHCYTKYCFLYFEHLHMVSPTIIHAIEHRAYRQDGVVL